MAYAYNPRPIIRGDTELSSNALWNVCFVASLCFVATACDDQPGVDDVDGTGGFGGGVARDGGGGMGGQGGNLMPDGQVTPDEGAGGVGGETPPECGDGNVDDGEECDDGNTDNGDGCDSDCNLEAPDPECGDGNVDDGEECDDGNTDDGDGCDATCNIEPPDPICGDGNVDDGEECDDGNLDDGDGCDANCAIEVPDPVCGDGNVDDGEECDDGNLDPGDGCDADCLLEPFCGDGDLDDGEECDDGNNEDGDGCDANCVAELVPEGCGDGEVVEPEACDDGNNDNGDGCTFDCQIEDLPCMGDDECPDGFACGDDGQCFRVGPMGGGCDEPTPIAMFGEFRGSTAGLEAIHGASCGGGAAGPESVFSLELAEAQEVCFNLRGSAFDTVLHVRPGDCNDAEGEIGCNDDDNAVAGGLQSALTVAVEPGTIYYAFVDGFGAANGEFILNVTPGACVPPPECEVDNDLDPDNCAEFEPFCVEGVCVGCRDEADCEGEGEACIEGICRIPPDCLEDIDCGEGNLCVNEECVPDIGAANCDEPAELNVGDVVEGSTLGRPADERGQCAGNGSEAVYQLTPAADGVLCLNTLGSGYDTALHVRTDCADPASEVACNDDRFDIGNGTRSAVDLNAVADTTYFVYVDGFAGAGVFQLAVTEGPCVQAAACEADADCGDLEVCDGGNCRPVECREDAQCGDGELCIDNRCVFQGIGGSCDAPGDMAGFGEFPGATAGEGVHAGSCGGDAQSAEAVFTTSFDEAGTVCFDLTGSEYDTVLYIRTACDDPDSEVACNDDNRDITGGTQSAISLDAEAGTQYFVFVDGFSGFGAVSDGAYVLNVTPGACEAPALGCEVDDECLGADRCLDGECVQCIEDVDCPDGSVCGAGNLCVECNNDEQCADDLVCNDVGSCVECLGDENCPDGVCDEEANACEECIADEDCAEGVCEANACVECREDANCAEGDLCRDGACLPNIVPGTCEAPDDGIVGVNVGFTEAGDSVQAGTCGGGGAPEDVIAVELAVGAYCANLAGSAFDTLLHVRSDCADPESEVACNDDNGEINPDDRLRSAATVNVEEAGTFFFFVDAFGAGNGRYTLTITEGECTPPPVCVDDAECPGESVCVENQCVECRDDEGCVDGVCGPEGRCVECNGDADCPEGVCGEFNNCVECANDDHCPEGVCGGGACVECREDVDCGEGNVCVAGQCFPDAPPLGCDAPGEAGIGEWVGVNRGESAAQGTCGGGNGPENVYTVQFENAGEYCINTRGSTFDTLLHIRTDCADPASEVACLDDNFGINPDQATRAAITLNVEDPAQAYFIYVDGFGAGGGVYTLTITEGACVAPPECAEDVDCGEPGFCVEGACVDCRGADGCAEGEHCDAENACVECLEDLHCGDDGALVCVDGGCIEPPECIEDADCEEGQLCRGNHCVPGAAASCDEPRAGDFGSWFGFNDPDIVGGDGGSCGGGVESPEDVFRFNFADAGEVCFDTIGSDFDTVLYIRGDCADPDSEVACNDDNFAIVGPLRSAITLNAEAGLDYFVYVDGFTGNFGGAGGAYQLNVTPGACTPPPQCVEDADCPDPDVCEAGNCVECREDAACDAGEICLENACQPRPECLEDNDCRLGFLCVDNTCVEDQRLCEQAKPAGFGSTNGTTAGDGSERGSCGGGGAEDVYVASFDAAGTVCISTAGSAYDTLLYVRTECADGDSEVACNDDAVGLQAQVEIDVEAATDYFIFIDGFAGGGDYTLIVADGACPAECFDDAQCDDAICNEGVCVECVEDAQCDVEGEICLDNACQVPPECGNGEVENGEDCDDGNLDNGDGCDAECSAEVGDLIRGRHDEASRFAAGSSDTWNFVSDGDSTLAVSVDADLTLTLVDNADDGVMVVAGPGEVIAEQVGAGSYRIEVTDDAGNAGYNVTFALDQLVPDGGDYAGAFVQGGDDWYSVAVEADATVQFSTGDGAGGCPGDTRLWILDANEEQVAFNDDGGVGTCSLATAELVAGDYFVRVDGFAGRAIDTYVLTAAFSGVCGDGNLHLGETCDDGNVDPGDGCDENCQAEPFCGDGNVDDGEGCDDGNNDNDDGCDENCQPEFECGNGELENPEGCDDGNLDNGDGCDAECGQERFDVLRGQERNQGAFIAGSSDSWFVTVDHTRSQLSAESGDGAGGCPGDTRITVYASADGVRGEQVAFNDDGGEGLCSLVTADLDAGTYEVVVDGFGGRAIADYTVDISLTVDVNGGGDFDGATPQGGDDWYVFTVEADTTVTLRTGDGADGCPGDTRIWLYSADDVENAIANNDDGGGNGLCSLVEDAPVAAGSYVVRVDGFAGGALPPYVLSVTFPAVGGPVCGDGNVDDGEECDDGNADNGDGCDADCTLEAFEILRGFERRGGGFAAGSSDTFFLTADGPSVVSAFTGDGEGGCPGDTLMALHVVGPNDVLGPELANNDDGGVGTCSRINAGILPAAGRYAIVVRGFGDGAIASYQLDVAHFTVAAAGGDFPGAFPEDGSDIFGFQLETGATVTVETGDGQGGCPGDTRITFFRVLDADGNREQIGFNDDGGEGACSLLAIDLPAGLYSAEVDGFGGRAVGPYVASIAVAAAVCGDGEVGAGEQCDDGNADNGDGCDALCSSEEFVVDVGRATAPGRFAPGSSDTWTFTAHNDGAVFRGESSDANGGCPGDTRITLFSVDAQGARAQVGFDDDGGEGLCSLLDAVLDAGDYAVQVDGFAGGGIAAYVFDFALTEDVNAGGDFAGGFGGGGNDRFGFTLDADGAVTLATNDGAGGCPGDTVIELLDANGDRVARNDDGGGNGVCSFIEQDLAAGDYVAQVTGFGGGGVATYVLSVGLGAPEPVVPGAGDLVITELMLNPFGGGERDREWFEVYVAADGPLLMRGVQFEDDEGQRFHIDQDLIAEPGQYLVFAVRPSPDRNGGVDNVFFAYAGAMTLRNAADTVRIRAPGPDGVVIDEVNYDANWPRPDGASTQLGVPDPGGVDNNDPTFWCAGTDQYGPDALGTPGAANNPCIIAQP